MGQAAGELIRSFVVLASMLICVLLNFANTDALQRLLKTTGLNVMPSSPAFCLRRWLANSYLVITTQDSVLRDEI